MIGLLSYLWFNQWNIETDKFFFAVISTFEFACEITVILAILFVLILEKIDDKGI